MIGKTLFLTFILICSCASKERRTEWDSGAQKQEATEDEMRYQQQEVLRNQFPGGRF